MSEDTPLIDRPAPAPAAPSPALPRAARLADLRQSQNFTQAALAARAGQSAATVSQLERGLSTAQTGALARYVAALGGRLRLVAAFPAGEVELTEAAAPGPPIAPMAAPHPGLPLREAIAGTGLSVAKVAELMGISRQRLLAITLGRKAITPDVAVRLGKLLGTGADHWVQLQAAHDTAIAVREIDVRAIPTVPRRG